MSGCRLLSMLFFSLMFIDFDSFYSSLHSNIYLLSFLFYILPQSNAFAFNSIQHMATSSNKIHCDTCTKAKATYKCDGCSVTFCRSHLNEHQQLLNKQLQDLENQRNIFRESATERSKDPQIHCFIEEINQWETESIKTIQELANKTKQFVIQHTEELFQNIGINFDQFTKELKETREEDDFNDIHLHRLNLKLQSLQKQLNIPSNISVQRNSSPFINQLYAIIPPSEYKID